MFFSGIHHIFDYKNSIEWSENIQDLMSWLSSQKNKQAVTFCSSDAKIASNVKGEFL